MLENEQIVYIAKHLVRTPSIYNWKHFKPVPSERHYNKFTLKHHLQNSNDHFYGNICLIQASHAILHAQLYGKMKAYVECQQYKQNGKKIPSKYLSSSADADITLLYSFKVKDKKQLMQLAFAENVIVRGLKKNCRNKIMNCVMSYLNS